MRPKISVMDCDNEENKNELDVKSESVSDSQEIDKGDTDVDFELARTETLLKAAIAFDFVDINGDGTIVYSEAEKMIRSSSLMNSIDGDTDTKVNAFLKSFVDAGVKTISKNEWLNFYGKLFDNVISNGLSPVSAKKE